MHIRCFLVARRGRSAFAHGAARRHRLTPVRAHDGDLGAARASRAPRVDRGGCCWCSRSSGGSSWSPSGCGWRTWGTWVDVVLAYLGVLLIVGAPLLFLPTIPLAVVTAVVALASAPLDRAGLAGADQQRRIPQMSEPVFWLSLRGSCRGYNYRLTNLLPFLLFGALLMRGGLARDRSLDLDGGHRRRGIRRCVRSWRSSRASPWSASGSYPDTLHDVGPRVPHLCPRRSGSPGSVRPRAARVIAAVFEPLRALGSLALSLYRPARRGARALDRISGIEPRRRLRMVLPPGGWHGGRRVGVVAVHRHRPGRDADGPGHRALPLAIAQPGRRARLSLSSRGASRGRPARRPAPRRRRCG